MLAAKKLAGTKYDVLLIERESDLGGILKNSKKIKFINDQNPNDWIQKTKRLIENSNNIKVLRNTLVNTYNFKG